MMRGPLTRQGVGEAIGRLRPHIEAAVAEAEPMQRQPDHLVEMMRDAGLFGLWVPKEYGGSELDLPSFVELVEEFAQIDASAGWIFAVLGSSGLVTAYLPAQGAREIMASATNVAFVGTASPKGRAVPTEGGFRVSGRWPLVSGAHHADWLGGSAVVFDGDAPRMLPIGMPDIRLVNIPRSACTVLDTWHSSGLRGSDSTDFAVDGVFVPERYSFPLFAAQSQVSNPLFRAGPMALFFTLLSAVFPGIARAAIDAFIEIARVKTPTLSTTGLASRPTVHAQLAKAHTLVASSAAYLHDVVKRIDGVLNSGEPIPDALEAERRLACVHVGACCTKAIDLVVALAGTNTIYSGGRLERCFRDAHTVSQHLAVSPVWWEKTGQYYLGLGLGMP